MNLTHKTPVEIDTVLAEIHGRLSAAYSDAEAYTHRARKCRTSRFVDETSAVVYDQRAAILQKVAKACEVEMAPFDAEFNARGGWTRAFIVAGGHVHSSLHCSSCYPTTQFGWLTQLSGHDETEIVDEAGDRACTICFKSAPVNPAPSRLFHADEIAQETARVEREAKTAAKSAAKAEKALLTPVKGPHGKIETLAAAKSSLTDAVDWPDHPYYADGVLVEALTYAIHEKTGEPVDLIVAAAKKRAAKR